MKKHYRGILYAALLTILFFVGAGTAGAEVGVTDNEIKIGTTLDLSGPIAFMGKGINDGASLYFKYINDQGGIYGRKIKFIVEDDAFQPPRAVQGAKKLITKDNVFCMTMNLSAAAVSAMYPLLEEYKIPMFIAGTANDALAVPPRKYLFIADTGYVYQGILAVKYIVQNLKEKNPKIACIYQDEITGKQYLSGIQKGCEKYGVKNLLELSYKRGAVDFSAQIAKCKEAGITHIITYTNVREPAAMMKEAQRVQYKAVYMTSNASLGPKVLELAGDAVDYANGYYGTAIINDINTEDTKGYQLYKTLVNKYKMAALDNTMNIWAFSAAMNLCEILKRAGKDLTREGAIKAAETFRDEDNGIGVPLTWTPDRRDGGRAVKMVKAVKGQWVPITGWINIEK